MNFTQWALKWGIPFDALADFKTQVGMMQTSEPGKSEAAVQNTERLRISQAGGRAFRNNVGAAYMRDGGFVRYGLANESKAMNSVCKSSDLICIQPVVIQPDHVGTTFGKFVARECKPEGWHYTGTERELGQMNFINLINSLGGDARFVSSCIDTPVNRR